VNVKRATASLPSGTQDAQPTLQATTHIRSTLLMSSQATLRSEMLFDRYWQALGSDVREELTQLGAPSWMPLRVGLAHYQACDELALSDEQVVAMCERVSASREGTFLGVAMNLARGAGVTPHTMAAHAPRIWTRAFMGGAIRGTQLGPKDLRVDIERWPFARIPYCRHAVRGLCLGLAKLVVRTAYAKPLPGGDRDSVSLLLSWT
jgi:hypothetical protein